MLYKMEQFSKDNNKDYNKVKDTKNIIFLDIDGVLQPLESRKRFAHDLEKTAAYLAEKYKDDAYLTLDPYDVGAVYYDWDYAAIGALRKLVEETRSSIVVHSSWISSKNVAQLKALFRLYDLDSFIIDRVNPKLRKEEAIKEYLNHHQDIGQYIVIDDDYFVFLEFGYQGCLTKDFFKAGDYEYCMYIFMHSFRFEHTKQDEASYIRLYSSYSNHEEYEAASMRYKLISIKSEKNLQFCLFDVSVNHSYSFCLILLNYAVHYFSTQNIVYMISNSNDILNQNSNIASQQELRLYNKETYSSERMNITTVSVRIGWYSPLLHDNSLLIMNELKQIKK